MLLLTYAPGVSPHREVRSRLLVVRSQCAISIFVFRFFFFLFHFSILIFNFQFLIFLFSIFFFCASR